MDNNQLIRSLLLDLPEDPAYATEILLGKIIAEMQKQQNKEKWHTIDGYSWITKVIEIFNAFIKSNDVNIENINQVSFKEYKDKKLFNLYSQFFNFNFSELKLKRIELEKGETSDKALMLLGKRFAYSLEDDEIDEIKATITKLRKLISEKIDYDDEYKRRLLIRLNALERELHNKMSNLDKFFGVMTDIKVFTFKLIHEAPDAKPFIAEITELTKQLKGLIWGPFARAEKLPEGLPEAEREELLLGQNSDLIAAEEED